MQSITELAYQELREGAKVLEADRHGDKVLRLKDGSFLKIFRRKRLISSALFWPYAKRFADNCQKLHALNIPSPNVLELFRLTNPMRDIVHYDPLPGFTLRDLRNNSEHCPNELFTAFGRFVAALHEQGVYFRSVHLGNVVLTPQQEFGLIDVADLRLHHKALSTAQRVRNFKHMLRDSTDTAWLKSMRYGDFIKGYTQVSTSIGRLALKQHLNF